MNLKNPIIPLLLLVPAPSIGAYSAMVLFPDSLLGSAIFALSKIWLFGLPAAWHLLVERGSLKILPPQRTGLGVGALSGLLISAAILCAYFLAGDSLIDKEFFRVKMRGIGLASPLAYLGGMAYWILVNSVLEEYVWRWFVVGQLQKFLSAPPAVILSALFFTLHHFVALSVYFSASSALLCSIGVFIGGAAWSCLFIRYRSIWPAYLSHAIVDLCIFAIGASMIFFRG